MRKRTDKRYGSAIIDHPSCQVRFQLHRDSKILLIVPSREATLLSGHFFFTERVTLYERACCTPIGLLITIYDSQIQLMPITSQICEFNLPCVYKCILVFNTTLCDKIYQWLIGCRSLRIYLGSAVFSTSKMGHHNIIVILLKMGLITLIPSKVTLVKTIFFSFIFFF